jgi:hypothetical protein
MADSSRIFNSIFSKHPCSMLIVLLVLLFLTPAYAQDQVKQVTTVGKAIISGNMTYDQARGQALNQARALAVEEAAGVNINNVSIIQDSLMLTDLVKTFSYGYLVNETSKIWSGSWVKDSSENNPGYPVIEVSLTGSVKVLPKSFFRNYLLSVALNKQTFNDGDNAQISIKTREDMYVVIANYTSKNNIVPVFPSPYDKNNLVKAGYPLTIPKESKAGVTLTVNNYNGHKEDIEAFLVFAFPKTPETDKIPWSSIFEAGEEINYATYFNTLLDLPAPSVAQQTLVYRVVNNDLQLKNAD